MNFLITGATGLIGKKLTKALLKQTDSNITVLTRNRAKATSLFKEKVAVIDKLSLTIIEQQDVIINLAGEPIADKRWSPSQKKKICQSRWQITQDLLGFINQAKKPPKVFISGSAIGIYGRQNQQIIDEGFVDYHQEFSHTICQQWEAIALKAQSPATRVALLRTGIVLSTQGGALAKMLLPFKLGLGGKMASGEQRMSWVHIDDMVAAIIYIINNQQLIGAINITAPEPVSNQVFSSILAKTLSRPCIFSTPTFMLKLLFGEMADLLIYGQNVVPKKLRDSGFRFEYEKLSKALESLIKTR